MMVSLVIVGVACRPISPVSLSIACRFPKTDSFLEVDDPVGAERADHLAGVRVERDQPVAGGDVDDAVVTLAVGPIGDAAARELTRGDRRARSLAVLCVHMSSPVLASTAMTERRVPAVM